MSAGPLELFFSSATDYYIAGRFAALSGLGPVAGNLLHHAIEMFLKGALSTTKSLDQLKKMSHRLPALWDAFKQQAADPTLTSLDPVVAELDSFEKLRYPDAVLQRGMQVTINVTASTGSSSGSPGRPEPVYELCLANIDSLVGAIFAATPANPQFFLLHLTTPAREYLREGNAQPWAQ